LKVEHIQTTDSTAVLRAKLGGMLGRILGWRIKRRFFFPFVLEDGAWRIRDIQLSSMTRRPRRGYRPEDFPGLDEETGTEIEAIQKLYTEFQQGLRDQDFHKAWKTGCRVEKRRLDAKNLDRLIVILAQVAVRLLQLRSLAEEHPSSACDIILSTVKTTLLMFN